jgi:transposase
VIQVTPQMRILVAVDPVDFRKGIDGLARVCRERLAEDPFRGTLFLFRNRRTPEPRQISVVAFRDGRVCPGDGSP